MSNQGTTGDSQQTQDGASHNKGITISSEALIGTLLAVLVVALGWGFWGYINSTINDNPRIAEILANQKEMQKDIQVLRDSISRLNVAIDFVTRSDNRPNNGGS